MTSEAGCAVCQSHRISGGGRQYHKHLGIVYNNWIEFIAPWLSAVGAVVSQRPARPAGMAGTVPPSPSFSVSHALRREQSLVSLLLKQLKLIRSKSILPKRPWIQQDQKPLVKQPLKVYQKFISMVIYLGKHIKMLIEMLFWCYFLKAERLKVF